MQHLPNNSLLQGGKYRIEKVLGQGGFGITYLATQDLLDRKVCIKEFFFKDSCVRTQAGEVALGTVGNKELVDRFLQKFIKEAQTISRLDHPNIIRILDVFKENGTAYYVMDFIEGESLEQMVKQSGALSEGEAMGYIKQVAKALDYLHQRRISHLDIKPANIMIRKEDNRAILIDFGVSKQYDEQGEQTSTTPVGVSHGYAPMEQYNTGGASSFLPQADIYSLGATLYKLVTGVTPPHAIEVFNNGLPSLPGHLSAKVVGIIKDAMRPRSNDRPKSVSTLMVSPSQQNDESTKVIVAKPVNKPNSIPKIDNPTRSTSSFWKWILPLGVGLMAALAIFLYSQKYLGQTDGVPVIGDVSLVDSTWEPVILDPEEQSTTTLLYVKTSPSGASVYMDGQDMGTTPIDRKKVSHGHHIVRIIKSGYEPITKSLTFGDEPVVLNETLVIEAEEETPNTVMESDEQQATSTKITPQNVSNSTGTINGHKYVDLGLSVKWADRNVGASSPSDYGDYFAWGETSTKLKYTENNSETYDRKFSDIAGNSRYDVARANWGVLGACLPKLNLKSWKICAHGYGALKVGTKGIK